MIAINYEKLRVRIGLASNDNSKDADIASLWSISTSLAEMYCDRKFEFATDNEEFIHDPSYTISLRRYPIVTINSITPDIGGAVSNYHYDKNTGVVHFDGYQVKHKLTINYDGGYTAWPADLELALIGTFEKLWKDSTGTVSSGGVKTVKAGDLSITYDTGSGAVTSAVGGAMGGHIPFTSTVILDMYRRQQV